MQVFVYCNIRTKNLSIRALAGPYKGKVVASAERVALKDVEFKVSEAGRRRVRKTGRKNVHAGAVGTLAAAWGITLREDLDNGTRRAVVLQTNRPFPPWEGGKPVGYNPYINAEFRAKRKSGALGARPVFSARAVVLDRCKIEAAGINAGR